MKLASLGSGSKGNATLVASNNAVLMVDCGFTMRETCARLASCEVQPEQLDAILVTHEHGDHVMGILPLARKFGIPVYMTVGTQLAMQATGRHNFQQVEVRHVRLGEEFNVGGLEVFPVAVPHDAREPCQFVFHHQGKQVGVLTDLGDITPHIIETYRQCDVMLLEFNHDVAMLAEGPYPYSLKQRVGGRLGHLNNQEAAYLLQHVEQQKLQHLVLSHISEQNNHPELALAAAVEEGGFDVQRVLVADQQQGFDWLNVQ